MPSREDIIRDKTFPELGFGEDLAKRVFYVLRDDNKQIRDERIVRALSEVIAMLHKKKILTEKEIEDLLFDLVWS